MSSRVLAARIRSADSATPSAGMVWPRLGTPEPPAASPKPPPPPPETQKAELQRQMEQQFQQRLHTEKTEAFRQGEAAGRKQAAAEFEAVAERMARAIEEVAGHKPRLRLQAERDVVSLALAIARRVLHRQIQMDEEALLGLVKAAFENVALREVTEVRIHPQFVARIQGHLSRIGAPQAIQVKGDPSLETGAMLVETSRGTLDASIETQIEEIGRGLSDALAIREAAS